MLEDVILPITQNSDFRVERIWDFNLSKRNDQHKSLNTFHKNSNKTVIVQLFKGMYVFQNLSLIKYDINGQN